MQKAILPVVLGFLLVSCESVAPEWKEIPDEEARLLFEGAGLDVNVNNRKQTLNSDKTYIEQIYLNHESGILWGQGWLTYREVAKFKNQYFFDSGVTMEERVRSWYPADYSFEFGVVEKKENHMGEYSQLRYIRGSTYHCAGIFQPLGPIPIDDLQNRRKPLGTILVTGVYCNKALEEISDETLDRIFNAYDAPGRPKEKTRSY